MDKADMNMGENESALDWVFTGDEELAAWWEGLAPSTRDGLRTFLSRHDAAALLQAVRSLQHKLRSDAEQARKDGADAVAVLEGVQRIMKLEPGANVLASLQSRLYDAENLQRAHAGLREYAAADSKTLDALHRIFEPGDVGLVATAQKVFDEAALLGPRLAEVERERDRLREELDAAREALFAVRVTQ